MRITTLLALFARGAFAQPQTPYDKPIATAEQRIRRIEILKLQFPLENAKWLGNVDSRAMFTQGNGKVIGIDQLLNDYRNQGSSVHNSLEMIGPRFQQFGETAVLTYLYTRTRHEGPNVQLVHQHVRGAAV